MQIVIDISEDDYRKIQDGRASVTMMRNAIRNGTPLEQVLKDIRREINDLRHENMINFVDSIGVICGVLEIIDKYREVDE